MTMIKRICNEKACLNEAVAEIYPDEDGNLAFLVCEAHIQGDDFNLLEIKKTPNLKIFIPGIGYTEEEEGI